MDDITRARTAARQINKAIPPLADDIVPRSETHPHGLTDIDIDEAARAIRDILDKTLKLVDLIESGRHLEAASVSVDAVGFVSTSGLSDRTATTALDTNRIALAHHVTRSTTVLAQQATRLTHAANQVRTTPATVLLELKKAATALDNQFRDHGNAQDRLDGGQR